MTDTQKTSLHVLTRSLVLVGQCSRMIEESAQDSGMEEYSTVNLIDPRAVKCSHVFVQCSRQNAKMTLTEHICLLKIFSPSRMIQPRTCFLPIEYDKSCEIITPMSRLYKTPSEQTGIKASPIGFEEVSDYVVNSP